MAITKKVQPAPASKKNAAPPPAPVKQAAKSPAATAIVPANAVINMQSLIEQDAGSGLEGISAIDLAIPRLGILQALSPQCNKADDGYIPGAEPGMILESVSNELFDGDPGVLLVLVSYRRAHLEWVPRQSGGGFVADHGPDPKILNETTKDKMNRSLLLNGNEIIPTAEYFAFLVDENTGGFSRVLISMSKSQMKRAKKINTLASSLIVNTAKGPMQAPLFYRMFRLGTVPESNEKGSWFSYSIKTDVNTLEFMSPIGEQIYLQARQFKKDVTAGTVKVAEPKSENLGGEGSTDRENNDDSAPM